MFHCLPEEVILSIDKDSAEFIAERFMKAAELVFFPAEIAEVFVKPIINLLCYTPNLKKQKVYLISKTKKKIYNSHE
ncbi:hypothetical protein LEP1GSC172_3363 [Leptospira noguchii]|uniref:Uncharacterized protein n=1 Tax=Leptospira noguchii TaxID=28182 RepID=M6V701_9LEPT|nr:hypothetical protein LEP1GSC172_3363 [Leptospira noguchii]